MLIRGCISDELVGSSSRTAATGSLVAFAVNNKPRQYVNFKAHIAKWSYGYGISNHREYRKKYIGYRGEEYFSMYIFYSATVRYFLDTGLFSLCVQLSW